MTTTIAKKQNGNPSVSFGNVVDTIFQNSLRHFFDDTFWDTGDAFATLSVPVNVRETEQNYEIDVIAPGCQKEDFSISIKDNLLTISYDHKEQKGGQNEKEGWARNEYVRRSFTRSFSLNDSVDVNLIDATYTEGILRLTLPKNERAKKVSRNIEIK
jgi:HSP20 family protein